MKEKIKIGSSFKWTAETRDRFNQIVKFKLQRNAKDVLEEMVINFIKDFKTDEGKKDIYTKYYGK